MLINVASFSETQILQILQALFLWKLLEDVLLATKKGDLRKHYIRKPRNCRTRRDVNIQDSRYVTSLENLLNLSILEQRGQSFSNYNSEKNRNFLYK